MRLTLLLSLAGAALLAVSYSFYIKGVLRRVIRPNASSWSLFVFLTSVNAITYVTLTGDWVKSAIAIVSATICWLVFIISLRLGQFEKLVVLDKLMLGLGIVAIIAWVIDMHAPYASLIVISCLIISTIPIVVSTAKDRSREKPLPWFMGVVSYAPVIVAVVLRPHALVDLGFPIVGLLSNASVWLAATFGRKPS